MFNTLKYISRYIGTIFSDNCAETFNCLIGKETKDLDRDTVHTIWSISGIFPGGRGRNQVQRGGGGAHPSNVFRGRRGLFMTSACLRFCKSRVLFCTQVRSMGGENPLTIHEIYAALTPSDSRSDWASEFSAAKQVEDYKIYS